MIASSPMFVFFFFNDPAPTEFYPLSLHDALPISPEATSPVRPTPSYARSDGLQTPPSWRARPIGCGCRCRGRGGRLRRARCWTAPPTRWPRRTRTEEHNAELQSPPQLLFPPPPEK